MIELKVILGTIAVIIALISYVPYFRDIFQGKTKPHAYSWLVWSILTGTAFFGQVIYKAGAGAWVTGITSLACFIIFLFALKKGEKNITYSDKLSLFGAFIALILWYLTSSPLTSIILIIIIDIFGFYPTFRKSYHKPNEETMLTFFLNGLKFLIAIIALQNYSVITYLYPASLVVSNWIFVGLLIIRRKKLNFFRESFIKEKLEV